MVLEYFKILFFPPLSGTRHCIQERNKEDTVGWGKNLVSRRLCMWCGILLSSPMEMAFTVFSEPLEHA